MGASPVAPLKAAMGASRVSKLVDQWEDVVDEVRCHWHKVSDSLEAFDRMEHYTEQHYSGVVTRKDRF